MKKNGNPKVKILVCCHKPGKWLSDDVYMPIQCGKAISDVDLGIQGDDTGDNISAKNPSYCELTAMYWAWKNLKDVDYIGLCHYRRYFNFKTKKIFEGESISVEDLYNNLNLLKLDLERLNFDILLPNSRFFPISLMQTHVLNHGFIDYVIMEKVIIKLYPEYGKSIEYVFYHCDNLPQRNMFIMKYSIFIDYCKWLFSILFEIEKYIYLSPYKYDRRILGFMGEMLLPLYVYHNRLKFEQKSLVYISGDCNNSSVGVRMLKCCINKVRFKLNTFSDKYMKSAFVDDVLKQEGINID